LNLQAGRSNPLKKTWSSTQLLINPLWFSKNHKLIMSMWFVHSTSWFVQIGKMIWSFCNFRMTLLEPHLLKHWNLADLHASCYY
jgi:hypothetical protein